MARNLVRASSHEIRLGTGAEIDRSVGTMSLWIDATDTTNTLEVLNFRVDGSNEIEITEFNGNASLNLRAVYTAGGVSKQINAGSTSGTSWSHIVVTWDKVADQFKFYVNGTQVGTTQTGLGTFSGSALVTYSLGNNPFNEFFAGAIAEYAAWNVALNTDDITALYKGFSPRSVKPNKLVSYVPLDRTIEIDLTGNATVTLVNSPTQVDGPALYRPASVYLVSQSATPSGAMSGVSAPTFSTTGILRGAGALSGASAPTFTTTAIIRGAGNLSGTSTPAFTTTAILKGVGALSGVSSPTFSTSGILQAAGLLTGVSTIVFTTSGAMAAPGAISGLSSAAFTTVGILRASGALSGTVSVAFSTTARPSGGAIWTPIAPASGTWANQLAASGTWTAVTPATGIWTPIT